MTDEIEDGTEVVKSKRTTLLPIRITRYIDAEQAKKDLSYTQNDLSGAFMQQASMLLHYGTLYAKAARQVDKMKLLLEASEAKIYRALKRQLVADGEKPTDASLRRDVAVHDAVVQLREALAEAEEVEVVAKIAVEAFKHRKDMLVQEGARDREELKGEARLMARGDAEEMRKAGIERFTAARAQAAANTKDNA